MNRDETRDLLRTRSALTSQPYGDDAIDAWHEALGTWPLELVRTALIDAAREHQRVTVAHVHDRLPRRTTPEPTAPEHCELCGGTGWLALEGERAHNPRTCRPDADHPCACTAVRPCRCTTGRARVDVHHRILEHNARANPQPRHDLARDDDPLEQLPL